LEVKFEPSEKFGGRLWGNKTKQKRKNNLDVCVVWLGGMDGGAMHHKGVLLECRERRWNFKIGEMTE
jgi:hypothetical protein